MDAHQNIQADRPGLPNPSEAEVTESENARWATPVSFPEWQAVLALEPLDMQTRARHARSIIGYLAHCKTMRERASIAGAKRYLEARQSLSGTREREGLRWFFIAARRHHGADMPKRQRESLVAPPHVDANSGGHIGVGSGTHPHDSNARTAVEY